MIAPMKKTCTKCGKTKALEEFYRQSAGRFGRCAACKECVLKRQRKYRAKTPEKARERQRKYRAKNLEKVRRYYWKNRDAVLERQRKRYRKNRDAVLERQSKRRAETPENVRRCERKSKRRLRSANQFFRYTAAFSKIADAAKKMKEEI